jgi:hypothetical protein
MDCAKRVCRRIERGVSVGSNASFWLPDSHIRSTPQARAAAALPVWRGQVAAGRCSAAARRVSGLSASGRFEHIPE